MFEIKRNPLCKFSIKEEKQMVDLYKSGLCLREVGNKFSINASRVQKILKANRIKRRLHGEGTRMLHDHVETQPPLDFPHSLKKDFRKLIAVLLMTDGHIKNRGYSIKFICTDKILQAYFIQLFRDEYGFSPTIKSFMRKNKETSIFSKDAVLRLLKLSPSYKKCPYNMSKDEYLSEPQPSLSFLENEKIKLLKECVRLAMSTEGSVCIDFPRNTIRPKLEFGCVHPKLCIQWKNIFERAGIEPYFLKSKYTWSKIKGLGIAKLKSIEMFIKIGGFIEGVNVTGKSKYYKGVSKNELLRTVFKMKKNSFHFPEHCTNVQKNMIIRTAVENAKIGDKEKLYAIKRLKDFIPSEFQ